MSTPREQLQASTLPAATVPLPAPVLVPLLSRRRERALWLQKLQHAVPAGALLEAGVEGLLARRGGPGLSLALLEVAFGALLLRSLVVELRALPRWRPEGDAPAHGGVDWTEVLAAAVLAVEALEHWHTRGHFPRPTALLAAVTLILGLTHARVAAYHLRRRALRIDDDGVRLGGRVFRRFSATWDEILRIDIAPQSATIATRSGRVRVIDLADLRHPETVAAALTEAQRRLATRQATAEGTTPSLTAHPKAGTLRPDADRRSPHP